MTMSTMTPDAPAADVRITPFHALGADVRNTTTALDALHEAGVAGLNVRKVELFDGAGKIIPGKYGLQTGDGHFLSKIVVGDDFRVVQFEDNAAVLDAVAQRTGATFDAVGTIGDSMAFVSMRLPEEIMLGGDDPITAYIFASMSHRHRANWFGPTAIRFFCTNQQPQLWKRDEHRIVIRHTNSAPERTALAVETLTSTMTGLKEMTNEAAQMRAQTTTDDEFWTIVEQLYPKRSDSKSANTRSENRKEILTGIWRGETTRNITGTAWGAYQAITEYAQWEQQVRGGDDDKSMTRAQRTLTSGVLINNQIKAYDMIREYYGLAA